jgi:hypothetical protein
VVGTTDVQVLADDLLKEGPAGDRTIQDQGARELGLEDGDVVAVARGAVVGEGVRQDREPLAG